MEASRHLRSHEKNAVTTAANEAKRVNPYVHEYEQKLGELGIEYKDPETPELGFSLSITDGVPVPEEPQEPTED